MAQVPTPPFSFPPAPCIVSHIVRPLFHLANLKEELVRFQLSAEPASSLHRLRLLMCGCVYLPWSVFGLPKFLTCLSPVLVQWQRWAYMGRNQGRAHKYLKLCALLQKRQSQKALLHYLRHKELVFVNSYQLGWQHYSCNKRYNMNYTVFFSLHYLIPSRFWAAGEGSGKKELVATRLPFAICTPAQVLQKGYWLSNNSSPQQAPAAVHWTQLTSLSLKQESQC